MSTAPFPFTLADPLDEQRKRLTMPVPQARPMLGLPNTPPPDVAAPPINQPMLQVGSRLPNPNAPQYNPPPRTGLAPRLTEVGLTLLGGRPAEQQYANAPKVEAQQRFARDTQLVKDESTLADQEAQARERSQKAGLDVALAQKALTGKPEPEPKTVETGSGVWQYNEDTNRYDIPVSGGPKTQPKTPNEEEQAISDHLKSQGLPDTPANRDTARSQLKTRDREPRQPNESEQAISDYIAANKLPNSPENRNAARTAIATQKATLPAEAKDASKVKADAQSVVDKLTEAQQFAAEKTGPGDIGLILAMVEATRPKAGFRMTQTEWNMIQKSRSTLGDIQALMNKVESGQLLTPTQRQQMLDVIGIAAKMAQTRLAGGGAQPGAAQGAPAGTVLRYDAQGNRIQ